MEPTRKFTLMVFEEDMEELKRIAAASNVSVSWFVRRLIRDFLDSDIKRIKSTTYNPDRDYYENKPTEPKKEENKEI